MYIIPISENMAFQGRGRNSPPERTGGKRIAHEKELEEAAAKEQEKSDDAYNASTGSYPVYMGRSRWMTRPSQPWTKF